MTELQLTLTDEERDFLVSHLQQALKETLVEEHRTRNLAYRAGVVQQEQLIQGLLQKLEQTADTAPLPR